VPRQAGDGPRQAGSVNGLTEQARAREPALRVWAARQTGHPPEQPALEPARALEQREPSASAAPQTDRRLAVQERARALALVPAREPEQGQPERALEQGPALASAAQRTGHRPEPRASARALQELALESLAWAARRTGQQPVL